VGVLYSPNEIVKYYRLKAQTRLKHHLREHIVEVAGSRYVELLSGEVMPLTNGLVHQEEFPLAREEERQLGNRFRCIGVAVHDVELVECLIVKDGYS
jgi:hypothetical protein